MAEACNTATSYIGLMEIYKNVPKLSTIERIAKALDVDPLDLFKDHSKVPLEQETKIQNQKKVILSLLDKELDSILHNL